MENVLFETVKLMLLHGKKKQFTEKTKLYRSQHLEYGFIKLITLQSNESSKKFFNHQSFKQNLDR